MSELVIKMKHKGDHIGTVTKQVEGDDSAILQEVIETIGRNVARNPGMRLNFDVEVDGATLMSDFVYMGKDHE